MLLGYPLAASLLPFGVGCAEREAQSARDALAPHGAADFEPAYLRRHRDGSLKARGEELWEVLRACRLCPRECRVNRIDRQRGICRATSALVISSHHPHFGEEPPLVGDGGSGTIFFSNCALRCVFCINWTISHRGEGQTRSIEDLADMMLTLQQQGCHNINVVTPTHYVPHIVLALDRAAAQGLRLPFVYNTCGWEQLDILRLLDGVVDIYLPDFKYGAPEAGERYSAEAKEYPSVTANAFLEMQRQVGVARIDPDGLIRRGLMIRHLVMPNRAADTRGVIDWVARHLPKDSYVNLMSQYTPFYRAKEFPEIARRLTREEYVEVIQWAKQAGLTNVHTQRMPPRA
ncbi:MAG: radical SAM protein [Spartobacteria bacterium]|nr:radical SAM protein [Spartobacteria bacterium]